MSNMGKLKLGYARENFSPDKPVRMNGSKTGKTVYQPVCVTGLSFRQGQTRVLVLDMDMRQPNDHFLDIVKPMVAQATGIPQENIVFQTTHNHSYPDISCKDDPAVIDWRTRIGIPAIVRAAEAAVADEKVIIGMEGGTAITANINAVRRYQRADGTWRGIATANPSKAPIVAHESEADPELRAVRIHRDGGKAVVLVNYQTHAASALVQMPEAINADFVGPLRDKLEKEDDVLVAYLQGACGNCNYLTRLPSEIPSSIRAFEKVGEALAEYTRQALAQAKPLALGKLQYRSGSLACTVNHTKDHLAPQAIEIGKEPDPDKKLAMMHAVGIDNRYERGAIIKRLDMPEIEQMEMAELAIGDLAFTFDPVELFDTCGKQLRDASPYPMTFNCCYALNYRGYMPAHDCWPHGEYEVVMCHYLPGTGESMVLYHLAQLKSMRGEKERWMN